MNEFLFTKNQIIIKNTISKRAYISLPLLIAISLGFMFYNNPSPTLDIFFEQQLTMQVPVYFIVLLLACFFLIVHSTTFEGEKKQLVKHTIFGKRKVRNFNDISEINRVDEYFNTVHSGVKYEIKIKGKQHGKSIKLCSFLVSDNLVIQNFEEKILPAINIFINK